MSSRGGGRRQTWAGWSVGWFACAGAWSFAHGHEDTASAAAHVPPGPPQHVMGEMSYREMASTMEMDDTRWFGTMLLDHVEWVGADKGGAAAWDIQGWYGGDYDKLWLKTEGETGGTGYRPASRGGGQTGVSSRQARAELFWDRILTRWWDVQAGAREDFGGGPPRTWLSAGLQGLAPYWLDTEVTLYVGEQGRTAARLRAEYDLLLTQRWIAQPHVELNLYGKSDPERQVGAGLSDLELSLRLRYEIRRELAPYVGVVWFRRFGNAADEARAVGESVSDVQAAAGVRVWF